MVQSKKYFKERIFFNTLIFYILRLLSLDQILADDGIKETAKLDIEHFDTKVTTAKKDI